MGAMGRWTERLVTSHWRRIDEDYLGTSPGRLSAEARVLVTVLVVSLGLVLLEYVAKGSALKDFVANRLPALVGTLSPALGEILDSYRPLLRAITWALACTVLYLLIPALVVRFVFGEKLRDHGLSVRGFLGHLWVYVLLFVPVALLVWALSYSPEFLARYPFYSRPRGVTDFLVWELFYGLQFLSLEFFFRGFMLQGLAPKMGRYAILAMVMPYMMIHFGKPWMETVGSIVAGVVLGTLALRTRSIWGGVAIHVGVAWAMDVAAVLQKGTL